MSTPRLHLIDASGYIYRAFYSLPEMTNPAGQSVNAVYGYTRMLVSLIQRIERDGNGPDYLAAVFDPPAGRGNNFRRAIDPGYKANRAPLKPELAGQFDLVRAATEALGIPLLGVDGFEADDVLASYAEEGRNSGLEVVIVSPDKDIMQLVADRNDAFGYGPIRMWNPLNGKAVGIPEVREKFGVYPHQVPCVQALAGDPTDGIPGVEGIGIKTAAKIIEIAGTLEGALADPDRVAPTKRIAGLLRAFEEDAVRSKKLATLKRDVPLPSPLPDLAWTGFSMDRAIPFLERHAFRSILEDLGAPV